MQPGSPRCNTAEPVGCGAGGLPLAFRRQYSSTQVVFANGVRKKSLPDGTTVIHFTNGDLKEATADGTRKYHLQTVPVVAPCSAPALHRHRHGHGHRHRTWWGKGGCNVVLS